MTNLEKIGKLTLKNQGGFVVKMDFVSRTGRREKGSRKDITLGRSETQDPGLFGINNGEEITIHADVVAGKDKVGNTWFIYEEGNPRTAKFTISGTTLDNELGFNGIE